MEEDRKMRFDVEESECRMPTRLAQRAQLVNFLMKTGLAKNERQAMYILFGIIGFCVSVMIFFLTRGSNESELLYEGWTDPGQQIDQQ